ncbi:hypothetical protein ICV01_06315 [Polynucleobacter sp. MWH-Spelu-300-X4]|uniref:hypothetical protein n=1 Tax=Polynucleobacter sp. MWH-Spelu-300-X4 TaxID=2689109 RepID=UPI001BFE8EBA|nr:hypothetical protein [Polynucleobacter sp. MWH-Spelu-300-X4]QWD79262.1 hypothetical protein ICV01_06315 [Polynucleobacter sp. MWH-Spelu-300-X4]
MLQKNKKLIFISSLVLIVVYSITSSKWHGYAYPDKNNLSNGLYLGEFKNEHECTAAAINSLKKIGKIGSGHFECHKN